MRGRDSDDPGPGRHGPGLEHPTAEQLVDAVLAKKLPEGSSCTVLVARDGEVVYCEGFGMADREKGIASQCETVYDIGSITKQFTAAAVLKLETAGQLATTSPIGEWIEGVPRDKRKITLHHLLTHTAGLVTSLGPDYAVLSRGEMVSQAMESMLQARPGQGFSYSNVGYSVLAAITEMTSGMSYEEFLAKHLFAPAKMTQTGYVLPDWDRQRIAVEYGEDGSRIGTPLERRWDENGPYWNLRGNGGLLSTARDMFRWHRALEGDEVLDRRAKAKLFSPHVREKRGGDSYYGYGWALPRADGSVTWHSGGNDRSHAEFWRFAGRGAMVFWATSQVRRNGDWNFERLRLSEHIAHGALGVSTRGLVTMTDGAPDIGHA